MRDLGDVTTANLVAVCCWILVAAGVGIWRIARGDLVLGSALALWAVAMVFILRVALRHRADARS